MSHNENSCWYHNCDYQVRYVLKDNTGKGNPDVNLCAKHARFQPEFHSKNYDQFGYSIAERTLPVDKKYRPESVGVLKRGS